MSEAMVMCASTPEKVEILAPPAGAQPGDVVTVPGFEGKYCVNSRKKSQNINFSSKKL